MWSLHEDKDMHDQRRRVAHRWVLSAPDGTIAVRGDSVGPALFDKSADVASIGASKSIAVGA